MKAAAVLVLVAGAVLGNPTARLHAPSCPATSILVYHRFGSVVADSMTVRTATFRSQLAYLREHGHAVVPLRALLTCLDGGPAVPGRAVVITADDGHQSVYTDMLPVTHEFHADVTLFIYPSAISNASYALTWEQLSALARTGRFDIESHTYWHPNFNDERRRLGPQVYREFARSQLARPRQIIRDRIGVEPDQLAWPFGIHDDDLIALAREAGYRAGFTLDRRAATPADNRMALPRFLVTDDAIGARFAAMLPRQVP